MGPAPFTLSSTLSPDDEKDLENRFGFHPIAPGDDDRIVAHEEVRQGCFDLAEMILELAPSSRERSLAVTRLEEVMFWANASIARIDKDGARR